MALIQEIEIRGTVFTVSQSSREIFQKDLPQLRIPFSQMYRGKDYWALFYDERKKTGLDLNKFHNESVYTVKFPPLLDEVGIKMINRKKDFDLMIEKDLVRERLLGLQPKINIMGESFFVDRRNMKLIPESNPFGQGILFKHFEEVNGKYPFLSRILYDPKTMSSEEIDADYMLKPPEGIVVIELPSVPILDPVGLARDQKNNLIDVLMAFPIMANMEARQITWEKTHYHKVFLKNNKLERQFREKEKITKVSKRNQALSGRKSRSGN